MEIKESLAKVKNSINNEWYINSSKVTEHSDIEDAYVLIKLNIETIDRGSTSLTVLLVKIRGFIPSHYLIKYEIKLEM